MNLYKWSLWKICERFYFQNDLTMVTFRGLNFFSIWRTYCLAEAIIARKEISEAV